MTHRAEVTMDKVARAVGGQMTGDGKAAVIDVTHDSRQVRDGSLFVAVRGASFDGHHFISHAVAGGAAGIIADISPPTGTSVPWIQVADARRALALAAAEAHAHPSRELNLIGITGTNGKTTTAYLVSAVAEAKGETTAMMGTVESRIGRDRFKSERTTGEASDVQRFLRRAVDAGCATAVMECSSHAIDLHRCDALRFRVAIFTNLTPDHLDYHRSMEAYFDAKRRLFDGRLGETPGISVINVDDTSGRGLALDLTAERARVVTYALEAAADVTARDLQISFTGMRFVMSTPAGERTVHTPLVGRPHVYNLLAAAAATAVGLDWPLDHAVGAFGVCAGAPGRFEAVPHAGRFAVVVDYAHTDDALGKVLRTAREVTGGRVITVFGCGGDRDRTKRAPMGETAAALSDVVVLASDNPRTEDPQAILADVEVGLKKAARPYFKIADRRAAINAAIEMAEDGDLVLIAGKGHEDYQIIGREMIHFDDREEARSALARRGL
ncbi:MAG: UDP-N-acetylmuramoyl-L-alanyl-D-glutamate--2,6-diaminopimelate ligase [Pyrinomonadaceae bacterium]